MSSQQKSPAHVQIATFEKLDATRGRWERHAHAASAASSQIAVCFLVAFSATVEGLHQSRLYMNWSNNWSPDLAHINVSDSHHIQYLLRPSRTERLWTPQLHTRYTKVLRNAIR